MSKKQKVANDQDTLIEAKTDLENKEVQDELSQGVVVENNKQDDKQDNKNDKSVKNDKNAKDKKKKDKKKEKKGGLGKKTKETMSELKKVTWPSFGEVCKKTGIVIAFVLLFGLFIFGVNALLGYLSGLLA